MYHAVVLSLFSENGNERKIPARCEPACPPGAAIMSASKMTGENNPSKWYLKIRK
jgi:hypothetical protein